MIFWNIGDTVKIKKKVFKTIILFKEQHMYILNDSERFLVKNIDLNFNTLSGKIINRYYDEYSESEEYLIDWNISLIMGYDINGNSNEGNPTCQWLPKHYLTRIKKITKEEQILDKCKKLWNNSLWVKRNPHYGY